MPDSIALQASLQVADGLGEHVFRVAIGLAQPDLFAQLGLRAEAAVGTLLSYGLEAGDSVWIWGAARSAKP